jgi:hypothetical protein
MEELSEFRHKTQFTKETEEHIEILIAPPPTICKSHF